MRAVLCLAFLTTAVPAFAKETRDEWEPMRLPSWTQVSVMTKKAVINIADMGQFYRRTREAKSDCKIKTQGPQYIICINQRGDMVLKISYDSIGEIVAISEARIKLNKGGETHYEEKELVDMIKEFFN